MPHVCVLVLSSSSLCEPTKSSPSGTVNAYGPGTAQQHSCALRYHPFLGMGCKNEFVRNTVIIRYDNITQKEDKTKDFLLSNKTRLWHSSNHVLYKTKSKEPRSCPLDLIWLYNPKKSIQLFSFAMHNNFIFKTLSVLYMINAIGVVCTKFIFI